MAHGTGAREDWERQMKATDGVQLLKMAFINLVKGNASGKDILKFGNAIPVHEIITDQLHSGLVALRETSDPIRRSLLGTGTLPLSVGYC
ncbi:hypothetical protein RUM44_009314 [Polyplax serrata]|uniref:Uncharacterized protein n=1 Tax=Polyplax serrata TaxID=468196 RepID=A0ABR1AU18_POLSC